MPHCALVSDLDHTLVEHGDPRHKHLLAFDHAWTVHCARPRDSLLVFSTGRSPTLFKHLWREAPLLTPDVLICSVGTEIFYNTKSPLVAPLLSTLASPATIAAAGAGAITATTATAITATPAGPIAITVVQPKAAEEPMDTDMGEDTRREQPASAPKDTSAPASTHGPHFSPDPSWEAILDKGWDAEAALRLVQRHYPQLELQQASEQRPHKVSFTVSAECLLPRRGVMGPERLMSELQGRLDKAGLRAKVIYSGGKDVDVISVGAGKGRALAFILSRLQQEGTKFNIVQVNGDSGNDIDLFTVPGVVGCVVSNAHPELKQFADQQMAQDLASLPPTSFESQAPSAGSASTPSAPCSHIFMATAPYAAGVLQAMCRFGLLDKEHAPHTILNAGLISQGPHPHHAPHGHVDPVPIHPGVPPECAGIAPQSPPAPGGGDVHSPMSPIRPGVPPELAGIDPNDMPKPGDAELQTSAPPTEPGMPSTTAGFPTTGPTMGVGSHKHITEPDIHPGVPPECAGIAPQSPPAPGGGDVHSPMSPIRPGVPPATAGVFEPELSEAQGGLGADRGGVPPLTTTGMAGEGADAALASAETGKTTTIPAATTAHAHGHAPYSYVGDTAGQQLTAGIPEQLVPAHGQPSPTAFQGKQGALPPDAGAREFAWRLGVALCSALSEGICAPTDLIGHSMLSRMVTNDCTAEVVCEGGTGGASAGGVTASGLTRHLDVAAPPSGVPRGSTTTAGAMEVEGSAAGVPDLEAAEITEDLSAVAVSEAAAVTGAGGINRAWIDGLEVEHGGGGGDGGDAAGGGQDWDLKFKVHYLDDMGMRGPAGWVVQAKAQLQAEPTPHGFLVRTLHARGPMPAHLLEPHFLGSEQGGVRV